MGGDFGESMAVGARANNVDAGSDSREILLASAANAPHKITRREEISKILDSQDKTPMTATEKKQVGNWLDTHFDRLKNNLTNTVEKGDVVEAYSNARWSDKSRFLWSDMRMLKRVAGHFDELALGAASPSSIEKEDVDNVRRGATVERTEYDVTTTFPNGDLQRATKTGELFKRSAGGSLSIESQMMKLELKADGTGNLRVNRPDSEHVFGEGFLDIPLTRGKTGSWSGMLEGEELQLALDEHSVHMQSDSMEILLTTTGGFMRDPSNPESLVTINADGSINMMDDGKVANIGFSRENGIQAALDSDGALQVRYPVGVDYWTDGKGSAGISGGNVLPSASVKPDGTMTIEGGEKPTEVKPDENGTAQIRFSNGATFRHEKNGSFILAIGEGSEYERKISISADGVFTMEIFGDKTEFKPPELRKPPAINR